MKTNTAFEEIYEENKRRIHYQMHKMHISDPHEDFFQEGLCALWNAYETYNPDKGTMATYFNYTIRNRLIDKIRRESRTKEKDQIIIEQKKNAQNSGNRKTRHESAHTLVDQKGIEVSDDHLWKALQAHLTENQWKWVYYYIIQNMAVREIAATEHVSAEAVKSWGKQVRKKLRCEEFREMIGLDIVV